MRTQLFVVLAGSLLAACGGGDGSSQPDAKVYMDAAIDAPPVCAVVLPSGTVPIGTTAMRASGNWFQMPTSGPLMGKTVFFIGVGLPGSTAASADVLAFQVIKPTGGFTTNTPINFEADPTMNTAPAAAYVMADYNSSTKTAAQLMWASSGSITLTAIGQANGNMISGSVAATNYREINQMTGADVAGGCTLHLDGVSFALTQMSSPAAPENPASEAYQPTPADMAAIASEIGRLSALRGQ
jgi:hypothetical protein